MCPLSPKPTLLPSQFKSLNFRLQHYLAGPPTTKRRTPEWFAYQGHLWVFLKKGGCFWQALERWPSSRILGKGLSIFLLFAYFFGSNFGCITYSICRHLTNSPQGYYGWSKSLQCTGVHIDAFNHRYVLGGVYNSCWYLFTRDVCVMLVKCIIADFFHVRGVPNTINNVLCSTRLSPRFPTPALVIKSLKGAWDLLTEPSWSTSFELHCNWFRYYARNRSLYPCQSITHTMFLSCNEVRGREETASEVASCPILPL